MSYADAVRGLVIEPMTRADLDRTLEWADAEGWNPGRADAGAFWAADPGGFLVGRLDGTPVATISAVRYGPSYAFVGLYIVDPAHRGRGHGLALWKAAMAQVGDRVVGLDGVVDQEAAYRSSGFEVAWRNARHELAEPGVVVPSGRSVDLVEVDRQLVAASDGAVFPAPRTAFLDAWLGAPGHVGRAVVDGGRLRGWGVRRPCRVGHKVGPLVADDPEVADALWRDLAAGVEGPVFLDVPGNNPAAADLVARHAMPVCFETLRMYRGPAPVVDETRLFGITTFELG